MLPKFEFTSYLKAIQDHRIASLYLVPPIIILMTKNKQVMDKYDLSSVKGIYTGAAPLGEETADELFKLYPHWLIRQGYGMSVCLFAQFRGARAPACLEYSPRELG